MPYVEYDEVEAICSDCGMIFRSEDALAAHRTESHSGAETPTAKPKAAEYPCGQCPKTFPSEAGRARHVARAHASR